MERRYLVAAIAIIATFAITSRGFRALEHVSLVRAAHAQTMATQQCPSSIAARALAKIHTHLRPRIPEEAAAAGGDECSAGQHAIDHRRADVAPEPGHCAMCARAGDARCRARLS